MNNVSLYRRWRSQSFSEIIGQNHITRTLSNVVRNRKLLAHSYLFCGPRGTGKTSMARIFAKALNCRSEDGELPCNICQSCLKITEGSFLDVMEIDAASHTSVEMVREYIIDKVNFAPMEGLYKVYIIDEAHKLSNSSFNALLKTLEEPPSHVVFILATTHPNELLPTILSRCQRFDFKRISQEDIVNHLREICLKEGYVITENSLNLIASASSGALRDALVILEQSFSFSDGEITPSHIMSLLGMTDTNMLFSFSQLIAEGKISEIFSLVNEMIRNGKDIFQFVKDLTEHFRTILVCRIASEPENILNLPADIVSEFKKGSELYDTAELLRIIKILSELMFALKESFSERALLEVALVKAASRESDLSVQTLRQRVEVLEKKINDLRNLPMLPCTLQEPENKSETESHSSEETPPSTALGLNLASVWSKFLQAVRVSKISLHAVLIDTKPSVVSDTHIDIGIKKGFTFHKNQVDANINFISELLSKVACKTLKVTSSYLTQPGFMEAESANSLEEEHENFVNDVKNLFL